MEYLRNGVRYCLLLILLVLAFATGAHAAQDDYYYPNYDASANGCVDLMNYVKRVTVTVNGVDYTLNQLDQMRQQGTPLTMQVGDTISFNVLFGLQGRAYDPNDATLVDESNSTYVTYTHDTTMLDGTTVAAGSQAILDDSSLMKENTTKGNSYLRMDIGWLLDACPGNYNIEYTDGNVNLVFICILLEYIIPCRSTTYKVSPVSMPFSDFLKNHNKPLFSIHCFGQISAHLPQCRQ